MTTSLVVFTRDLRVRDNPALRAASRADRLAALFVFDDEMLRGAHGAPNRLAFLAESLDDLAASLRERGVPLALRRGDWLEEVLRHAAAVSAEVVHVAADVSSYAAGRLAGLERAAAGRRVGVVRHPGLTIAATDPFRTNGSGQPAPYQVFTPYYRRWLEAPRRAPEPAPDPRPATPAAASHPGHAAPAAALLPELARRRHELSPGRAPGGETAGRARLAGFAADALERYERDRDAPGLDATSRLSPYLHFGAVSPLEAALELGGGPGGPAFVRQLAWRDFNYQLLAARPDAASRGLRPDDPPPMRDDEAFAAWCDGRTGYPLVDAGMRQLRAEGWMHNRARLVTASFLTKDLGLDWRLGAAFFMAHLVDGDVANNQLNWQWTAGVGADGGRDRVFNPHRQAERFDPDGAYVRRFVVELADLADLADPVRPGPLERAAAGYPAPIVDHAAAVAARRARSKAPRAG